MFRKLGKLLFCGAMVIAAGAAAMNIGQKAAKLIQKENKLLANAGQEAANALRSVGEAGQTFLSRAGEKQLTLLVTGTDDEWRSADVILLMTMDLENSNVRMIQIPCNTYINREGSAYHTLSGVYDSAVADARRCGSDEHEAARKGEIALKGFLKENMGVAVDHYLVVRAEGLQKTVDTMGGVSLSLPHALDCDDDTKALHLHLSAGTQTVDGKTAVQLMRFQDDGLNAPKHLLSALFRKVKSDFSVSSALNLLRVGAANSISDLTLPDMIPLAKGMLKLSASDVKMDSLTGEPFKDEQGTVCKVLCRAKAVDLLDNYLIQEHWEEAAFDPHRIFTSTGETDELYYAN